MRRLIAMILVILTCVAGLAGAAAAERDWSEKMTMPTEEQLNQNGEWRSPYITFMLDTKPEVKGIAMDLSIPFDPAGTYICPACWNLDVSKMEEEEYELVWSDDGGAVSGYFGFQVLGDGQKMLIMSLWDAFCRDREGNQTQIIPKVLYPENGIVVHHTPETNQEGSFVQCFVPFEWETGKDYRFILEQETGEEGTELFILSMILPGKTEKTEFFRFDSGMTGVSLTNIGGFVENFVPELAAWPRAVEFRNVQEKSPKTGEWENVETLYFGINNSLAPENYVGSFNMGADQDSCWIITSGFPGLCKGPEKLSGYKIPH